MDGSWGEWMRMERSVLRWSRVEWSEVQGSGVEGSGVEVERVDCVVRRDSAQ